MPKFTIGDRVYLPANILPEGDRDIFAMRRCDVVAVNDRSIQVRLPDGTNSKWIGSSKAHGALGIALISIGDFDSEEGLINPLGKSILQFCRLLLPDDHISAVKIRAIGEFGEWWGKNHNAYTHIIIVGHGDREAIYFGVGGARKPISLALFANPVVFSIVKLGKATGAGHGQEIIPGVAEAVGRIVGTAA